MIIVHPGQPDARSSGYLDIAHDDDASAPKNSRRRRERLRIFVNALRHRLPPVESIPGNKTAPAGKVVSPGGVPSGRARTAMAVAISVLAVENRECSRSAARHLFDSIRSAAPPMGFARAVGTLARAPSDLRQEGDNEKSGWPEVVAQSIARSSLTSHADRVQIPMLGARQRRASSRAETQPKICSTPLHAALGCNARRHLRRKLR